jgi:hypothetical protein
MKNSTEYWANSACEETGAFPIFNVSMPDSLRVPLQTIQGCFDYALTRRITPDVYGHTLDQTVNENAAKGLGLRSPKPRAIQRGVLSILVH